MEKHKIEGLVLKVLEAVLKCDVDLATSRASMPKWDSLKHIEIIFSLEDELGLQFPEEALEKLDSVNAILTLADALLNESPNHN